KIRRAWDVPTGSSGKTVSVRFTLSDSGSVSSIVITRSSGDDAVSSVKAKRCLRLVFIGLKSLKVFL
ncbi:TonB C-terminal domain-containing protein, partial [Acinetobacter baumannii]|nr:TonB C-terminal domain-containing protein [Acinetobacter baumannii]